MLKQEQIVYVELLKREYSNLDKEALLKLFYDAQWSDAESAEALARFDGTYIPAPIPPPVAAPEPVTSPAWVDPPKASRYANIVFEDIVVEEPQKEVASKNTKIYFKVSRKNILICIGAFLTVATAAFVAYYVTQKH